MICLIYFIKRCVLRTTINTDIVFFICTKIFCTFIDFIHVFKFHRNVFCCIDICNAFFQRNNRLYNTYCHFLKILFRYIQKKIDVFKFVQQKVQTFFKVFAKSENPIFIAKKILYNTLIRIETKLRLAEKNEYFLHKLNTGLQNHIPDY